MKKCIVIAYERFDCDVRGQRLADILAEYFDTTVLTSDGSYNADQQNLTVITMPSDKRKAYSRYFDFVFQCKKYIRREKPAIVYGLNFYAAFPCLLIRNRVKKVLYDAYEYYIPEKRKKFGLRNWFFYLLEKRIIRKADAVTCANEERAQAMAAHFRLKEKPRAIRNISSLPRQEKANDAILCKVNEFITRNSEKTCLVYAGVIIKGRGLEKVLREVLAHSDALSLILVGDGSLLESLKDMAQEQQADNILFLGRVPYAQLASVLCYGDIGLLYYECDKPNNILCAPNKVFEYASVGLPMFGNENPTLKKLLTDTGIGACGENLYETIRSADIGSMRSAMEKFNRENTWQKERKILADLVSTV